MNPINLIIDVLVLVVGVTAGYFFHRYQVEQTAKNEVQHSEDLLFAVQA